MKAFFLVVGASILLSCSKPSKSLAFKTTKATFATIKFNESVYAKFEYINNSLEEVTIDTIVGSCDCLILTNSKQKVPVGGRGIIAVKFDSKYSTRGDQVKEIIVKTNGDPKLYALTLTGKVL